jgi:hypothetical protein
MALVLPIGEPVNEAERLAIAHLRDHLAASYRVDPAFHRVRDALRAWFPMEAA